MRSEIDDTLKRLVDLTVSALALPLLAGPIAAIGLAIKLDSPGPVFYRGLRVGRGGRPFRLLKFRSMIVDGDKGATSTSGRDPRVTRVGHFIRRYKLDELPQLWNVFVGDMSLVGPRPQVQSGVDTFSDEERAILDVRPGITDWASIRFHNEGEIIDASGIADPDEAYYKLIHPEKTRLQLLYVREHSLWVDFRILLETVGTLVRTRATEQPTAANRGPHPSSNGVQVSA